MKTPATQLKRHNVNLWIVPLRMSLGAVLLFAATMTPDMLAAYHVIHLPDWFTMGGIDDARAILGAMLGCVSTVLALIFSVALLVLSMVANLFGPRLLYRFVQDWVTQVCIGLFMAAFIYVFLVFLVTHQDQHSSFIPQVSLITSWFVVLGAFSFLVFYSHRIAVLIQNPDAIGRIVDDIRSTLARNFNEPQEVQHPEEDAFLLNYLEESYIPVLSTGSGYLQHINYARLVTHATWANTLIKIPVRPGQFVLEGETLAYVAQTQRAVGMEADIRKEITVGRHRILDQDIEFGIAQIVEIAIRALSPAINDTFTGIACVDLLGEALSILSATTRSNVKSYDEEGYLRVMVRPLFVSRLIRQAFDQVRQAAAENPAVSIRLLSVLGRLGAKMRHLEEFQALKAEANAVWEGASSTISTSLDRQDLEAALTTAMTEILASETECLSKVSSSSSLLACR